MADEAKVKELMQGACDTHIHTGPDVFPRLVNDLEAAQQAKDAGMKAIVIKNHLTATGDRAQIASETVGFPVFGGIALNHPVGGLNPQAVDVALRMGAKEVWMPTLHAAEFLNDGGRVPLFGSLLGEGIQGITILDAEGDLKKEVLEILALIAEKRAILGTGHISVKEAMVLVPQARKMGVEKIIVTHPLSTMLNYTINDLREIREKGASMFEHNVHDTTPLMKQPITFAYMAEAICTLGADTAILSSDGGQVKNPPPVAMLETFIAQLLDLGIKENDVAKMVRDNPARMLEI